MLELLPYVEVMHGNGPARASVIWLHGLGADGHDFEPIVPQLNLPATTGIRFIFPHAPQRAVTINNGYVMPAWFDILTLERLAPVDSAGISESITNIEAFIANEKSRGIATKNIVLAGFSQGGVIALHTAARHKETLAGVMALSTYLPLHEQLTDEIISANKNTPVFMAHGTYDPVLSFALGQKSKEFLQPILPNIEWHEYAMEHSVCYEEIQDVSHWLRKVLPDENLST